MQLSQNRWYVVAAALSLLVVSIGISGYLWAETLVAPSTPLPTSVPKAHPSLVATATPPLNMAANVHLLIPKIGIDAPVEPVHVAADGALSTPTRNQWEGVGWYQNGPIPGQTW